MHVDVIRKGILKCSVTQIIYYNVSRTGKASNRAWWMNIYSRYNNLVMELSNSRNRSHIMVCK